MKRAAVILLCASLALPGCAGIFMPPAETEQAAAEAPQTPPPPSLNALLAHAVPDLAAIDPDDSAASETLLAYLEIALPYKAERAWQNAGKAMGTPNLAWDLAYDLRAATLAYERTGDVRYLDLFDTAYESVLRMRDDKLGIEDDTHGRIMAAWGTNHYSSKKKKWTNWPVHAGMITYPAIHYCLLVRERNPGQRYAAKCDRYAQAASETVRAFESDWGVDKKDGSGYYLTPNHKKIAPLNQMNALGRTIVGLYRLTGKAFYKARAEALAKYFKKHLRLEENGSYVWEYWPGRTGDKRKEPDEDAEGEDLAHAQINVHFALLCHEAGIVFDAEDMARFTNTLTLNVMRDQGDWARSVTGHGDLLASAHTAGLQAWTILSRFGADIAARIEAFARAHPDRFPLGWFSYATGPIGFAEGLTPHPTH